MNRAGWESEGGWDVQTTLSVLLPFGHGGWASWAPQTRRFPPCPPPPGLAAAAGFGEALISIILVWEVGQRGMGKISTAKLQRRGGRWF